MVSQEPMPAASSFALQAGDYRWNIAIGGTRQTGMLVREHDPRHTKPTKPGVYYQKAKDSMMNPNAIVLIAAVSLSLLRLEPTNAAESIQDVKIDIPFKKFVLTNGLTLIVHEDHKAPIVAVNLWYHVGSKNEKPGKTGFAHLFEHLMFTGSEHFKGSGDQRAFFEAMEKIGATDLNGTTNPDRTDFFENVPRNALDVALWIESDRMGHLLGSIDQAR